MLHCFALPMPAFKQSTRRERITSPSSPGSAMRIRNCIGRRWRWCAEAARQRNVLFGAPPPRRARMGSVKGPGFAAMRPSAPHPDLLPAGQIHGPGKPAAGKVYAPAPSLPEKSAIALAAGGVAPDRSARAFRALRYSSRAAAGLTEDAVAALPNSARAATTFARMLDDRNGTVAGNREPFSEIHGKSLVCAVFLNPAAYRRGVKRSAADCRSFDALQPARLPPERSCEAGRAHAQPAHSALAIMRGKTGQSDEDDPGRKCN